MSIYDPTADLGDPVLETGVQHCHLFESIFQSSYLAMLTLKRRKLRTQ